MAAHSFPCVGLLAAAILSPASAGAAILFQNVTGAAGLSYTGESYGASWGDFDRDGFPDLFVNHHRQMPGLYVNRRNGTFVDRASSVQVWANAPTRDQHGGGWGDFDRDGDLDLLVSTGRGSPNQLLVNENGQLVDRTAAFNVGYDTWAGRLPVWLDYDNDGLLDFIMAQYNGPSAVIRQTAGGFVDRTAAVGFDCTLTSYGQLLDIDHDGHLDVACQRDSVYPYRAYDTTTSPFTNIGASIPSVATVMDTVLADFDGNLQRDVFYVRGTARAADAVIDPPRNVEAALEGGTRSFSFVTSGQLTVNIDWQETQDGTNYDHIKIGAAGVAPTTIPFTLNPASPSVQGTQAFSQAWAPSIYIGYNAATQRWTFTNYTGGVFSNPYFLIASTAGISGLTTGGFTEQDGPLVPALYLNTGTGFVDATQSAGFGAAISCSSGVAEDFDNDMDVDLYLICRSGVQNLANRLYENLGNGVFALVPGAGGAAGPQGIAVADGVGTADSVVVADYDVDGFPDLFVTNGLNLRPKGLGGPDLLFRNQGNANHWIEIDLEGTTSNRDAVGARVQVTAGGVTQLRVQDGGYHRWSQNSMRLHFGLAGNANAQQIRVVWPNGATQQLNNVAADRVIRIVQSQGGGGSPSACGEPGFNQSTESAVLVWQDCPANSWHARFIAGGGAARYQGSVEAEQPFTSLTPFSIEGTDVLDLTAVPPAVAFDLRVSPPYIDGFDFTLPGTASACFGLDAPTGLPVLVGAARTPMQSAFDLATLQTCTGQGGGPSPCGQPTYTPGTETKIYLWQDCGTGLWSARFDAGGSFVRYTGTIQSNQPFTTVAGVALEPADVLTTGPATSIQYNLGMRSGEDGIDFSFPASANVCFGVDAPAGASLVLGAAQTPVPLPFNLRTLGPC